MQAFLTTRRTHSTVATRRPTTQQKQPQALELKLGQALRQVRAHRLALELKRGLARKQELGLRRVRARKRAQVLRLELELKLELVHRLERVLRQARGPKQELARRLEPKLVLERRQVLERKLALASPWTPLPKPSMMQLLAFNCPQASAWTLWSRPSRILPLRTQRSTLPT